MKYDLNMEGTTIEIVLTSDGSYSTFEDVRKEILKRDAKLVINDIVVNDNGNKIPIPLGLDKIKEGASFDDLLSEENRKLWFDKLSAEEAENLRVIQKQEELANKELQERIDKAKATGDWEDIPEHIINDYVSDIILTTSMFVANHEIEQELEVITAECAYGMNVFRDLFASVRDIVGGRSKATEKVLHGERDAALSELRIKAHQLGADAVIAIDLEYTELSGGTKNGMLLVVATGTAVTLNN